MMKAPLTTIAGTIVAMLLSSCATTSGVMNPEYSPTGGGRVNIASANQLLDAERELAFATGVDDAIKEVYKEGSQGEKAHRRNMLQDRLVIASNNRCNVYKGYLRRIGTANNATFGVLSTLFGSAGAIANSEGSARTFAGLSAASNGIRGEMNQAIFGSLTTGVIIPGIEKKRKEILSEIDQNRSDDIKLYTAERAVADAIRYHGACSLDSGIEYAQESVQARDNPGLRDMIKTQELIGAARTSALVGLSVPSFDLTGSAETISWALKKTAGLKSGLDSNMAQHQNALAAVSQLETRLNPDGDYGSLAKTLDSELQGLLLQYSTSTGTSKSDSLSGIKAQQMKANSLRSEIEAGVESLRMQRDRVVSSDSSPSEG